MAGNRCFRCKKTFGVDDDHLNPLITILWENKRGAGLWCKWDHQCHKNFFKEFRTKALLEAWLNESEDNVLVFEQTFERYMQWLKNNPGKKLPQSMDCRAEVRQTAQLNIRRPFKIYPDTLAARKQFENDQNRPWPGAQQVLVRLGEFIMGVKLYTHVAGILEGEENFCIEAGHTGETRYSKIPLV